MKFNIEFSKEQMQVLNDALVELPYKKSAPIIMHINTQIKRAFDARANDGPTGQTIQPDEFGGD